MREPPTQAGVHLAVINLSNIFGAKKGIRRHDSQVPSYTGQVILISS